MRVGVLASGRGSNLGALIKAKKDGKLPQSDIVVVISNKDDARVLTVAQESNIETLFIDSKPFKGDREGYDAQIVKALKERSVDLVVFAGYMRIISKTMLDAFGYASSTYIRSLPSFPGLHAQKQALDHGVKISGCTVHFVDEGVDTGPIILQQAVEVKDDDTEETLSERILKFEHQNLPKALDLISRGLVSVEGRKVYIKSG